MRIGLPGGGRDVDAVVRQAERAEADGFSSLWYTSGLLGDPLAAMVVAGRATDQIELGTAILQTYPCHPVLQAGRVAAAAIAIGAPGRLTLGLGPSHAPMIQSLGIDYSTVGRHTEEYVAIVAALLRGEAVDVSGAEYTVTASAPELPGGQPVSVLVSALAPRLTRVAGQYADGAIPWMANARAIESHLAPRLRAAADDAGRPAPRLVAGLPVAVHDDVAEAREVAARLFAMYGTLPNYVRVLELGGVSSPAEAAIVGDEASVTAQLEALLAAGATDVWAAPFPVGDDPAGSRARTRALLSELARS